MTLDCSIVIVTYNSERYLHGCLDSVQPEAEGVGEVIVVDNASTDGTTELIAQHWPWVTLIRNAENVGFAAACNQGARAAGGEYLVFLNQDTRVLPGWLDGLLSPLNGDGAIGLTTSKLLLMQSPGQINTCGQEIHFSGIAFNRGVLDPSSLYPERATVSAVCGASFAVRKNLWDTLGGFDDALFMYYEDTDLSWRAQLAGYSCVYAPQSVAYHDGTLHPSVLAFVYSARNRLILTARFWKIPTLLMLSPGLLLAEIVDWGAMVLIGREALSAKLSALKWLSSHARTVQEMRKDTQARRRRPDWVLLQGCSAFLSPRVVTGGRLGRWLIGACNLLFGVNYRVTLAVARLLDL